MNKVSKHMLSFFKDQKGKVVLAQWPNIPLIVWFIGFIINKVTTDDLQEFAGFMSFGALIIWAGLEIFYGVNYFRRALGAVVLIFTIVSRFSG